MYVYVVSYTQQPQTEPGVMVEPEHWVTYNYPNFDSAQKKYEGWKSSFAMGSIQMMYFMRVEIDVFTPGSFTEGMMIEHHEKPVTKVVVYNKQNVPAKNGIFKPGNWAIWDGVPGVADGIPPSEYLSTGGAPYSPPVSEPNWQELMNEVNGENE